MGEEAGGEVLPVVASALAVLMTASMGWDVAEFEREGSTGPRSAWPYLGSAAAAALCVPFGVLVGSGAVLWTNVISLVLGVYFAAAFQRMAADQRTFARHAAIATATVVLPCAAAAWLVHAGRPARAVDVLGTWATVDTLVLYASPLLNVMHAVRTGDTSAISPPFAVLALLCGASWTVVGLDIGSVFVWGPSALGAAVAMVQLLALAGVGALGPKHEPFVDL